MIVANGGTGGTSSPTQMEDPFADALDTPEGYEESPQSAIEEAKEEFDVAVSDESLPEEYQEYSGPPTVSGGSGPSAPSGGSCGECSEKIYI